ncbi:PepSY domain-containing protein [Mucilaginibacter sp. RS28]|uniref:PepSY domain-containing protein n=1 Tax=Mucilaginibacter straminoryzae TaxID=2932774 RepID=A0A9X2B9X6_9SPHI|nr:PepSY-associated TM helix domain-containing protein [Mucilaginibacter straminoryzae]MCJ8208187.1 PepSY domain-containing protein [Mucilaginibacter straminoryzae]
MTIFKRSILFLHRWLGFISGLVVFVVSLTGCLFCFQDEIQDALYDYRHVTIEPKPYLPPSAIKQKALRAFPGSSVNYIYYYGKDRPAGALANVPKKGYYTVLINPYNGKVLHSELLSGNFFVVVEYIHLYLLLPPKIGQMVVGVSVLIFVALMITGIILWWPKRKSDRKRSFRIKWNGRWRRVNYDLHNVLGFYASAISLILAITGLSMSFKWVEKGIYNAGNLGKNYPIEKIDFKSDSLLKNRIATIPVIDRALIHAQQRSADAKMFLISDDGTPLGTIGVTAYQRSMRFGNNDTYQFDRYTGKLLKYLPNEKKSTGLKLNDLNYDIHVGQVAGLTGKIIAFLASLICASLPITGLIIYLGKKKKPKTRKVKHYVDRRQRITS